MAQSMLETVWGHAAAAICSARAMSASSSSGRGAGVRTVASAHISEEQSLARMSGRVACARAARRAHTGAPAPLSLASAHIVAVTLCGRCARAVSASPPPPPFPVLTGQVSSLPWY
jgi:hypothetical protein